jgi:AAA+ ATPase superfamily predicted ATPase
MKIHLIIPPSPFLLDEKVFMSLGILKIAAVLESSYDVNIIDLSGDKDYINTIKKYANELYCYSYLLHGYFNVSFGRKCTKCFRRC